jgi:dihydrolipoamide dehydrogenase
MTTRIAVLGAGPGGYMAAVRAAQLGADVTLVEKDQPGGTCLNWGCIPSKVLITTADLLRRLRRAPSLGIELPGEARPRMDWLQARKQKVVADQIQGLLKLFAHHRIRFLRGAGRLEGPGRLRVRTTEDAEETVPWDRIILATGTRPLELPGLTFDGRRILSSDHALSLTALPESIVILGGGVIGCEFACLLAGLGVRVAVVEALPRLLPIPSVDEGLSKVLLREFKKQKIDVHLNRTVTGVEDAGAGLRIATGPSPFLAAPSEKDRRPGLLEADQLLVCVGRAPNTGGIGLETVGVSLDARGWIEADAGLQTTAPHVWAIGDVLGPSRIMLAHAASAEGACAAANALGGSEVMDYRVVPGAIFTHPEVAAVGLTEAQAREQGLPVKVASVLFRSVGKAQVLDELAGEARLVAHAATGVLLGAHLIGAHATELIPEATLAVRQGLTVDDLAAAIHAHPTLAEVLHEAALAWQGRPLHG